MTPHLERMCSVGESVNLVNTFSKIKSEGRYEDDEMRTKLPYKKLFGASGAFPSHRVEQKIGERAHRIHDVIKSMKQRV